jgi:hypothetical protein
MVQFSKNSLFCGYVVDYLVVLLASFPVTIVVCGLLPHCGFFLGWWFSTILSLDSPSTIYESASSVYDSLYLNLMLATPVVFVSILCN